MIGSVFGRVATIVGLGIQNRGRQEPNSADFFGLLPRSSERRKNEAESENDREPDQPHAHLGGGWLAGSLTEPNYGRCARSNASHAARCVACHGVRSHPVPVALVGECSMPARRR